MFQFHAIILQFSKDTFIQESFQRFFIYNKCFDQNIKIKNRQTFYVTLLFLLGDKIYDKMNQKTKHKTYLTVTTHNVN